MDDDDILIFEFVVHVGKSRERHGGESRKSGMWWMKKKYGVPEDAVIGGKGDNDL